VAWPAAGWVAGLLKEFADVADDASDGAQRTQLRELLRDRPATGGDSGPLSAMCDAAAALLRGKVGDSDLVLHRDAQQQPVRLVLVDRRRAWADERVRQVWLPQGKVTLASHHRAVGERAAAVAGAVGLPAPLVDTLRAAGDQHDAGKADPRFQTMLGRTEVMPGTDGGELLAKSGQFLPLARHNETARKVGLPVGWRHEQLSVVEAWTTLHETLPPELAQLAARLVGTSHGTGRVGFPHTTDELLPDGASSHVRDLAVDLFDHGAWDQLIDTTDGRWGVWGCAYLEALLRAADGRASAEGT
jgi:CRISPR-associated endonuclease/helicase Cas3